MLCQPGHDAGKQQQVTFVGHSFAQGNQVGQSARCHDIITQAEVVEELWNALAQPPTQNLVYTTSGQRNTI